MKLRCGGTALGVVALLSATPIFAQSVQPAPASPFLMLDQERMYQQSDFGLRVISDLKLQADALSAENQRIDAALTEEEQRLTDERPSMEPADFRALAVDFDERVTAIRKAQVAKQNAIREQGERERSRFFELAFPVLLKLVEETGAVAILNNTAVIFSVRKIDITDEAIARINREIGDAPPAPGPGPQPVQRP